MVQVESLRVRAGRWLEINKTFGVHLAMSSFYFSLTRPNTLETFKLQRIKNNERHFKIKTDFSIWCHASAIREFSQEPISDGIPIFKNKNVKERVSCNKIYFWVIFELVKIKIQKK